MILTFLYIVLGTLIVGYIYVHMRSSRTSIKSEYNRNKSKKVNERDHIMKSMQSGSLVSKDKKKTNNKTDFKSIADSKIVIELPTPIIESESSYDTLIIEDSEIMSDQEEQIKLEKSKVYDLQYFETFSDELSSFDLTSTQLSNSYFVLEQINERHAFYYPNIDGTMKRKAMDNFDTTFPAICEIEGALAPEKGQLKVLKKGILKSSDKEVWKVMEMCKIEIR